MSRIGLCALALALLAAGVTSAPVKGRGPIPGMKNVHLVAHTHDDTGWLKTVDQYYLGQNNTIAFAGVQYILDSVVSNLAKDPSRKFTYVEQAFFVRWWEEQTDDIKAQVRKLVKADQLQFVNGGWCMHDEANPFYIDMIDQTTLGHRFLKTELDVAPFVQWQIDPFGHSATNAVLFGESNGFKALYFGRADFRNYAYREKTLSREFMWAASRSDEKAKLFTGILLTNHYGPPGSFWWDVRDPPNTPIQNDKRLDGYNIDQKVAEFVGIADHDFSVTRGDHIMWTMGDDFNYQDANTWFKNMDHLIAAVNNMTEYNVFYSTPNDYTLAKEAERAAGNVTYPTLGSDFFPYADGPHDYWTGYYTSRPALKRFIRDSSAVYSASRQIRALTSVTPQTTRSKLAMAMGLTQHHDAVAGTSKQHVAFDYAKRLSEGREDDLAHGLGDAILTAAQATIEDSGSHVSWCPRANETVCPITKDANPGTNFTLFIWNALSYDRDILVEVPVPSSDWRFVVNGNVSFYPSPIPVTNYNRGVNPDALPYRATFVLPKVPALGYTAVPVIAGASSSTESKKKEKPAAARRLAASSSSVVFENAFISATFDTSNWIQSVTDLEGGNVSLQVTQDWCFYLSNVGDQFGRQPSGAYIFRNVYDTPCFAIDGDITINVISDAFPLMIIERTLGGGWIHERLSLGPNDRHLRHEFTVGSIPVMDIFMGMEVVSRWNTSVSNQGSFHTDSNGREMILRKLNARPNYPFNQTEPVAGNYYPVNGAIKIADDRAAFAVVVDSSVGGSSLHDGSVEVMVHRRLLMDDWRGVGEPLNETEYIVPYVNCDEVNCGEHYGPGLVVRGEHYVTFGAAPNIAMRFRPLIDELYHRPHLYFIDAMAASATSYGTGLELPDSIRLITLERLDEHSVLLRLGNQYAKGEWTGNTTLIAPRVDVGALLAKLPPGSGVAVQETTLTTNNNAVSTAGTEGCQGTPDCVVHIAPMQIRTFVAHFLPPPATN